jgi:hypothetical protein
MTSKKKINNFITNFFKIIKKFPYTISDDKLSLLNYNSGKGNFNRNREKSNTNLKFNATMLSNERNLEEVDPKKILEERERQEAIEYYQKIKKEKYLIIN